MVKKIDSLYECEECLLKYKEEKIAEKCEKWCKKNKSCNIKITKYAVKDK